MSTVKVSGEPVREGASLAAALAAFQAELPEIKKGNTATVEAGHGKRGYSYAYADLADVSSVVLPLLARHGLAWTSHPTVTEDGFVLAYELLHTSGESIRGRYPLPDPSSTMPQSLGSAITYARRYALCAVTGVAPAGDDDDGAAVNDRPAASRREPRQSRPVVAPDGFADRIANARDREDLRRLVDEAEQRGWMGARVEDAPGAVTVREALREAWSVLPERAEAAPELSPEEAAIVARFGLDVPEVDDIGGEA